MFLKVVVSISIHHDALHKVSAVIGSQSKPDKTWARNDQLLKGLQGKPNLYHLKSDLDVLIKSRETMVAQVPALLMHTLLLCTVQAQAVDVWENTNSSNLEGWIKESTEGFVQMTASGEESVYLKNEYQCKTKTHEKKIPTISCV